MDLNFKITAWLAANGKGDVRRAFVLSSGEDGVPFIAEWDADTLGPRPTQQQLDDAGSVAWAQQELNMLQCTRSQFKLAALELGKLDAIEAFVAASGNRELQIRWNDAPMFLRSFEGWDAMAGMIGETPESVTNLFRLALTK